MKELRHTELRATQTADDELIVEGRPVVFDEPAKINDPMGGFTEIIERHALNGVDLTDTRLLYNHDANSIPLAKAPRTMELWLDDKALNMRAKLPDTEQGRSVYEAIKRQDLDGMSFAFTCDKAGSHYDVENQTRTISKINKILECSIVPFPAYQITSVEARNQMQEAEEQEKEKEQLNIMLNKMIMRSVK